MLKNDQFDKVVDEYLFTGRKPLRRDILNMLEEKPKLLQRKSLVTRVTERVLDFVDTYITGMPGFEEEE